MVLTILLDSSSLGVIYHFATGNSAEGGGLSRPCETLLDYASQALTPYTKNLTDEIEKVQRPAARFVMSDCRNYEPGSVTSDFVPKVNMAAASAFKDVEETSAEIHCETTMGCVQNNRCIYDKSCRDYKVP